MKADTKHIHDEVTRKRLGQYFTKKEIATLMVDISKMPINSVSIDPMCGTGNMLTALIDRGYDRDSIYGIDIDPKAVDICVIQNGYKNIKQGNAFCYKTYDNNLTNGVDFVITNPPYIRYQNINESSPVGIDLPDSKKVRIELLKTVGSFKHLTKVDKDILIHLIKSYSGLSDMAVPSWLLCAALVKKGGKIAIVVPDTWLNRDYAVSVQYLLLKWFDVEYILEDVSRSWFMDAQVKTMLLIAKRRESIASIHQIQKMSYKHVKLFSCLQPDLDSNIINYKKGNTEDEFALIWKKQVGFVDDYYYVVRDESLKNMQSNVLVNISKLKGIEVFEDKNFKNIQCRQPLPSDMKRALAIKEHKLNLESLEFMGIHVGQGLRTGANKFFYLRLVKTIDGIEYLQANSHFNEEIVKVPKVYSSPVLQKQCDLPNGYFVNKSQMNGRVLYVQTAITSKDFNITNNDSQQNYTILNEELENYIIKAENMLISDEKPIPTLSAVKPNARFVKNRNKFIQRFWYMLPSYTSRHIPDFCVARINDGEPKFYLLEDREIVVDANFCTIWVDNQNRKYAYLAIFNSLWMKAFLGCISTIMGGGALKVEASHIKKVFIPKFDTNVYNKLNQCGKELIGTNDKKKVKNILYDVDQIMLQNILGKTNIRDEYYNLYELVKNQIDERKKK